MSVCDGKGRGSREVGQGQVTQGSTAQGEDTGLGCDCSRHGVVVKPHVVRSDLQFLKITSAAMWKADSRVEAERMLGAVEIGE